MTPATGSSPCPQCGKPASGNFCQNCGASLGGRFCNQCGAELGAGARFCNQCGAATGAAGGAGAAMGGAPAAGAHRQAARAMVGGSNLPWWIAGFAMFALIVAVGVSVVNRGGGGAAGGGAMPANPATGASAVDLNSMTPIEAADRLFDRVMRSLSASDTAGAMAFMPMALGAYERAEPLDLDALLHYSMLQAASSDYEGSLATAQRMLDAEPDHVLGLAQAAEACDALGRTDEAVGYFQHLMRVYDEQSTRPLVEYQGHQGLMADKLSEAQSYLAGR